MPPRKRSRTEGKVTVLYHEDCLEHDTSLPGEVHQEGPDRIVAILKQLKSQRAATLCNDFPLCRRETVLLAHSEVYLAQLESLDRKFAVGRAAQHATEPVPLSPHLCARADASTSATRFSMGTMQASLRAAGAVVRAVDMVMEPHAHDACFCLVRPPGHHSGVNGYDAVAGGCGFCILNNGEQCCYSHYHCAF
jgi:acetoin utilization deacetylase AcuC-like enzyme